MANPAYWFPDSLNTPDFELRKMTLTIFKIKTLVGTSQELKNKLLQLKEEAISQVKDGEINSVVNEITKFNGDPLVSISLPIPNELNDTTQHNWNLDTGLSKSFADSTGLTSLQDGVLAKVAASQGMNKPLVNPGYFQNYTGSEPRSFTFTYNFIPNNQEEAERLVEIITLLKKYSSPTQTAGLLLTAPNVFGLTFGNPKLQKLTNIRPCVISNIDVNYSGAGFLETTMDGMPKYLILSINFSEIKAITSDDWSL
jgi:hypothetical protein